MQLSDLLQKESLSRREAVQIVIKLSIPAILAHMVMMLMEYIDAAMVGSLGAEASAAIGLVTTSVWLLGGLTHAVTTGFSVQVAHFIGAGEDASARRVFKQSIIIGICISLIMATVTCLVSRPLPVWLGGDESIVYDAGMYVLIYAFTIPMQQMNNLSAGMLQCSGNMKVPSIMQIVMCVMNIFFNGVFIFGFKMGVMGAAVGTLVSYYLVGGFLLFYVCRKNKILKLRREDSWSLQPFVLKRALKIGTPMGLEHIAVCGAMVATTFIVAPLGNVAISANSFAITAESFCYLPGYGFAAAATTLIGQSIGADRFDLAKRFARITTIMCSIIMTIAGGLMFAFCPFVFAMLTPVEDIRRLGASVLRIELFCEPLYAINLAGEGILRGAGDTLVPGFMNLVSIWGVRITMAAYLVHIYGLKGVWIAMLVELSFRGLLFLVRLLRGKWLRKLK